MVRQANFGDKNDLEQIFIKASLGEYGIAPYKNERINKLLSTYFINNLSRTVFATVFEINNAIVSTAMLSIKEQVYNGTSDKRFSIGIMHSVNTDENYRRKGYARQVIKELINIATNLDIKLVYIELTAVSDMVVELYKQCGFIIVGASNRYMRFYF